MSQSSSSSNQGTARTRAKKRAHDALDAELDKPMFKPEASVTLVDRTNGNNRDPKYNDRAEQALRRARVESKFAPLIITPVMPVESDAEITMYRESSTSTGAEMNSLRVFYDEVHDSWAMRRFDHSEEYYWALQHEAKLAVLTRWVQDPVLLGEMAQLVQSKIASMGQEAKASYEAAAAGGVTVTSIDLSKDEGLG